MPELDVFPKSHVVTFKYYLGVIQFLEEDYASVRNIFTLENLKLRNFELGRRKPHISVAYVSQRIFTQHRVSL